MPHFCALILCSLCINRKSQLYFCHTTRKAPSNCIFYVKKSVGLFVYFTLLFPVVFRTSNEIIHSIPIRFTQHVWDSFVFIDQSNHVMQQWLVLKNISLFSEKASPTWLTYFFTKLFLFQNGRINQMFLWILSPKRRYNFWYRRESTGSNFIETHGNEKFR